MTHHVAVVGAGLIGRAWAIVFARAGFDVALTDVSADALAAASEAIAASARDLAAAGMVQDADFTTHIRYESDLVSALAGAEYAQECGPEKLDAKQTLFAELEAASTPDTILASSTSGILASDFAGGLAQPERCLVAHPVNPPYLIPLVELVPSPATDPAVVERARALLEAAGQVPITVHREISGFVLNRLQGALLNEAMRLVGGGYVSAEDLDNTVRHGLGLRWSFMGPLETIDLNAPGGIADYAARYGPLYAGMAESQSAAPDWSAPAIAELERARRVLLPEAKLAERQAWRDRRLMALAAHKRDMDNTDPEN
ncbi:3-hydroxyacyl-CoA dehydrogenase [Salinisphaera hydrothermalis]|uniref:3-hydroxyacyl-CoA dehydrogenase n=1 Tax=Salinisphaera hydrothermalis (strain C41B8) TaxID=1304275 RepID=A0A084IPE0_SALHC|nr:3-hydroxyacyl-CoA dehydrogenase [Salinisphaera hydrothermalis]KEZ78574.1 3-hydroxyacyl-CoA dehydrogenase [Salinisphaera hydrothermalis C41B8]